MQKTEKKKPGPKPTGKGELVGVRLLPDLLDAVDKHQAAIGASSRPDAIRQVLAKYLIKRSNIVSEK